MDVARTFDAIHFSGSALLTIGTFDGVHRGHRYLLEQAKRRAHEQQYGLVIVTFDPCPAVVLRPSIGRYQLSSADQKVTLLSAIGPAVLAMLDFTPELSYLTAAEFMDALEARLDLREVWFGEDFRFGRDRGGDLQMLVQRGRESGFSLHVVSRRMEDQRIISSTRIRQALSEGDVEGATPLLGYPFGRSCGPGVACTWADGMSAAMCHEVEPHLALPADGVYAGIVTVPTGQYCRTIEVRRGTVADYIVSTGVDGRESGSMCEFINRLCTADQYRERPAYWDERLDQFFESWQRPEYEPIGHY
jgi:riboflavin kinase/FMN adenylyltransferase